MLTDRIERITPSATLEMTAKAAKLRSTGVDVINLSVGEPDFPTPENIRLAGKQAIDDGQTRYTPGGGKSGSPTLRFMTSTPVERSLAALAVISNVAEGVILSILSVSMGNGEGEDKEKFNL
jgi:aspartate/methionine/tyrosine aminotransferase